MRQLLYIMFITNNKASFHLWWEENLLKHQKISNIMTMIVGPRLSTVSIPYLTVLIFLHVNISSRHLKQKEQSYISKISIIISKSSTNATYGSNSDLLPKVFIKRVYFGIKGFVLKNPFRVIKDVRQLSWCYQIFLVLSNSLTI